MDESIRWQSLLPSTMSNRLSSKCCNFSRAGHPNYWPRKSDTVSIIALHGLGGTWNKTWTSRRGYCWLSKALASRFPTSRILSIDHPNILQDLASPRVDVTGLITDLLHERSSCKRSDHPIIFIGHSFGGNLLKQIFLATHPSRAQQTEYHRLHRSLRAYIYLGTPQKHISFPDVSALWRALEFDCDSTLGGSSSELVHAISNASRINDDFREYDGEDLPSLCFYETVKTPVALSEVSLPHASTG